jgi:hypothetical protein
MGVMIVFTIKKVALNIKKLRFKLKVFLAQRKAKKLLLLNEAKYL